ncbi:unnamed protein product [Cylindrotheca closterium]|uniref:DUF1995 domain-containing protein n=1 Tax=Cylindrotheca closterium TaxID=2856 RepID=A0AAD2CPV0_9STRA|nr:unnamed protein product [Cylindrotheca closterium]
MMSCRLYLGMILSVVLINPAHAWVNQLPISRRGSWSSSYYYDSSSYSSSCSATATPTSLQAARLSPLPPNISPFEKSEAKSRDITGDFRKTSLSALQQAIRDGKKEMEIEFPPLLESKSQFDDFDNVQELNKNRDWCIEWLPTLSNAISPPVWFVLPDTKEVELAKEEWNGQRFRQAASWTSIEAVTEHYSSSASSTDDDSSNADENYSKPWGATFAAGMSQLLGGGNGDSGLLGNKDSLDDLTTETNSNPSLHLVCQPGNGGPVEDWINVKKFHMDMAKSSTPTCIVNGALDKVRDGYYNGFIFPALAKTFDFYKSFESIFYLKPVSDKGVYGWLYRVYPEPWQVVLQTPYDKGGRVMVQDSVALVSDKRPTYTEAVQALLQEAQKQKA